MTEPRLPTGAELGLEAVGAPFRVLVIEASAYSAGLLRETAAPAGLSVDVARDPWEALDRLGEDVYAVVVIDLPNPQVSGEELYEGIAQLNEDQTRRVIFLVNDLTDPATRRLLTAAGRPFLTQPVDPLQLYDLVVRVGLGEKE
ncbi:MAG: response regulator [Gemmatimonadales bacterium]|jgi:CheY-like chemotaxis protein